MAGCPDPLSRFWALLLLVLLPGPPCCKQQQRHSPLRARVDDRAIMTADLSAVPMWALFITRLMMAFASLRRRCRARALRLTTHPFAPPRTNRTLIRAGDLLLTGSSRCCGDGPVDGMSPLHAPHLQSVYCTYRTVYSTRLHRALSSSGGRTCPSNQTSSPQSLVQSPVPPHISLSTIAHPSSSPGTPVRCAASRRQRRRHSAVERRRPPSRCLGVPSEPGTLLRAKDRPPATE
ncbi:hypothetical protein IWX90DRAFT_264113 [Phyllosticta citrichinensis]|uniref:Secreted protein n=1 Tax=Phyllosticta citrichinensis TaxID=1130410 RepID=A0ABR1XSB5_9PEZI